jgi:hypothetical protein
MKELFLYYCFICEVVVARPQKLQMRQFCEVCKAYTQHKPVAVDFEKRKFITPV